MRALFSRNLGSELDLSASRRSADSIGIVFSIAIHSTDEFVDVAWRSHRPSSCVRGASCSNRVASAVLLPTVTVYIGRLERMEKANYRSTQSAGRPTSGVGQVCET